jgi:hypothetical protein
MSLLNVGIYLPQRAASEPTRTTQTRVEIMLRGREKWIHLMRKGKKINSELPSIKNTV